MSQPASPEPSEPSKSDQPISQPSSSQPNAQRSRLQALLGMVGQLGGILLALVPLFGQSLFKLLGWLSRQFSRLWGWLLPKIRPILPAALRNLPDPLLSALIIALLALLLWIPLAISGRSSVAANPPAPIEAPAPKLDRNSARLAKLQTQISEAVTQQADPYGADLVQAVAADFARQQLTVTLADRWYGLTNSEQHQIAQLLLKQAKKQGFSQIEAIDQQGVTLARPAVVGTGMVLLTGA